MKQYISRYILTLVALFALSTGAWAGGIQGDVNADGVVDVADIAAIISVMHEEATYAAADVYADGEVNVADIAAVNDLMKQQSGTSTGTKVVLKAADINVANGEQKDIVINMDYETSDNIIGLAFSLYLPDGILLKGFNTKEAQLAAKTSALKKACDLYDGLWGEDGTNQRLTVMQKSDGGLLFVLLDQDDKEKFISTKAMAITISVHAIGDVAATASIKNISITSDQNASIDRGAIADVTFGINQAAVPEPVGPAAPEVTWNAATKQATFLMPDGDVVLTPIYAAATVYGSDGQTEKSAYASLKEAFANVQDGDIIKLDWNVTLTEHLETPSDGDGVKFTLDFNGYTIDGGTTYQIKLKNAGDQLTFTDSSDDQLGGLIAKDLNAEDGSEFVFVAGRYNFSGATAETLNGLCADTSIPLSLANGKEFIDIENAPDAKGFMVRVAYKDFELAIGPQKFVTFYLDQNVKLDETTDGVTVYTISGIDTDRSLAYVSPVSGVVAKETPILLYNATDNELTAKLTVTPDAATAVDVAPEFKGTAQDREFTADDMAAADYYALIGGKAFAPVYNPGTIGANKCWLEFAKQQTPGARQLTIVFDNEATGIQTSKFTKETNSEWYTIDGRKVTAPTKKGVYIQNGQKVVVR